MRWVWGLGGPALSPTVLSAFRGSVTVAEAQLAPLHSGALRAVLNDITMYVRFKRTKRHKPNRANTKNQMAQNPVLRAKAEYSPPEC